MPILSDYARKKKMDYFINSIPKNARILEIGCAGGWLGKYLKDNSWDNYLGIDIEPPADIVGDILNWKELGVKESSFDVIIAFEVVEHVNPFKEFFDILSPGGILLLTSPVPGMDWLCKVLEVFGLNQKRTSVHDNLIDFHKIPYFEAVEIKTIAFMSQWGIFRKPLDSKTKEEHCLSVPPFEEW